MAVSKTQRARRAEFARYKEDVKREGKPFFPYAMLHDTVMSLVVVLVIIGLACIWYFTAGDTEEGKGLEAGMLGPWYAEKADPGTYQFVPRPDWFFYFLFYLLRIFKWPETVVLGTVGIPTILLILLLGLPFYDSSRERRPLRRPVAMVTAIIVVLSMGVLTWKGATAEEALGSELIAQGLPEEWARDQGYILSSSGTPPARAAAAGPIWHLPVKIHGASATADHSHVKAVGRPHGYRLTPSDVTLESACRARSNNQMSNFPSLLISTAMRSPFGESDGV